MRHYIVLFFLVENGLLFSQPGTPPLVRPMESRAGSSYACEAPEDLQAAIGRAGRGGIESLVTNYPADFWVRRAYIDARTSDALGTIRLGTLGFLGDGSQWVTQKLKQMESIRDRQDQASAVPKGTP